jgi:uncharacterized protein YegP (UPF0339 family)
LSFPHLLGPHRSVTTTKRGLWYIQRAEGDCCRNTRTLTSTADATFGKEYSASVVLCAQMLRSRTGAMYYVMYKDVRQQWRWNLHAVNHLIIAVSSESYVSKRDCEHSISLVKASFSAPVYER